MMDELYFSVQLNAILHSTSAKQANEFLKQIALDARIEQARVDREAVDKLKRQAEKIIPWRTEIPEAINEVIAALTAVAPKV